MKALASSGRFALALISGTVISSILTLVSLRSGVSIHDTNILF